MNLGLTAPLWLSALAVLVPLVWLYLRTRKRPPAYVSSLVLWRAVAEPVVQRRRPRLPLLFFVQALLIVAGALALAQPFARRPLPPGPAKDAVIVLDVSASMQALEQGSTRFGLARDAARARAGELGRAGRRLTVIAAGQQPQVLGTDLDGARAAALIDGLEPRDTGGNLTAAAELAVAQAGAHGSLDVYTDAASEGLVLSRDARALAAVHRFGAGGANVALSGVRVVASPFDAPGRTRVVVTVRSYAPDTRTVQVRVSPLGAAADAKEAVTRSVTLAPGASEVVSIDGLAWTGPFQATLAPGDDLPLDDAAYGVLPAPAPLRILLLSEDDALQHALENLARNLGDVSIRTLLPIQYQPETAGSVTIFDRFTPPTPPPGNAVYLAPPRGNADVTVAGGTVRARFSEQREHPLTYGLVNAHTLLGDEMVTLAPSATMKPVLLGRAEGREVPLVLAGEIGARRVVATAFPLRAGDLRSADALPALVFAIDLMRWLAPSAPDAPLVRQAGERLRAGFPDTTAITRLEGPGVARDLGPSDEVVLEKAGVYTATVGGNARQLLVSFVDPTESDIARPAIAEPPPSPAPTAAPASAAPRLWQELPYTREVLLVVIAAMLLEWLVVAASGPRRRRRVADAEGAR